MGALAAGSRALWTGAVLGLVAGATAPSQEPTTRTANPRIPPGHGSQATAVGPLSIMVVRARRPGPRLRAVEVAWNEALAQRPGLHLQHSVAVHHERDESGQVTHSDPPRPTLVAYANRVDYVVCIGADALRTFLVGEPIQNPDVRIVCLGVAGLQWLTENHGSVANLERVWGGVNGHGDLAAAVRAAREHLHHSRQLGVIISDAARSEPIERAKAQARALGAELLVEPISDPIDAPAAGRRLRARGVQVLLHTDDLAGLAGRRGQLVAYEVRLAMIQHGVAVLGLGGEDPYCHLRIDIDHRKAATALLDLIQGDQSLGDAPQAARFLSPPEITATANLRACAVDRVRLR